MTTRLEKAVRRELDAGSMGLRYGVDRDSAIIVEISRAGISFRRKGRRFTIALPWRDAYRLAEHLAGEKLLRHLAGEKLLRRHRK